MAIYYLVTCNPSGAVLHSHLAPIWRTLTLTGADMQPRKVRWRICANEYCQQTKTACKQTDKIKGKNPPEN